MDLMTSEDSENLCKFAVQADGEERNACVGLDPKGSSIRHPPAPHYFTSFITPDEQLFQTIHMGLAIVDTDQYSVTIDGLVKHSLTLSLAQLRQFPSITITAFHECYGSPLKLPTENVWRIGNVKWTGVSLRMLLEIAQPLPIAKLV